MESELSNGVGFFVGPVLIRIFSRLKLIPSLFLFYRYADVNVLVHGCCQTASEKNLGE